MSREYTWDESKFDYWTTVSLDKDVHFRIEAVFEESSWSVTLKKLQLDIETAL